MREIKFRGKRTDNKEWVYGQYFDIIIGIRKHYCIVVNNEAGGLLDDKQASFYIDRSSLCQYIGKNDKNKEELYENDIVRYKRASSDFIGVIEYNEITCRFSVRSILSGGRDIIIWKEKYIPYIEKIGNIYDNPELLKEEK